MTIIPDEKYMTNSTPTLDEVEMNIGILIARADNVTMKHGNPHYSNLLKSFFMSFVC